MTSWGFFEGCFGEGNILERDFVNLVRCKANDRMLRLVCEDLEIWEVRQLFLCSTGHVLVGVHVWPIQIIHMYKQKRS